jgi:sigma-E factor negative regulatory protein RseB
MTRSQLRPTLFACLLCALPATTLAGEAREWLSRMENAVESLSYEGTFVHMVGNRLETMHVIHRAVDGQVAERLYSRDQPGREILRQNGKVTCIFADQQTVLVERRGSRHGAPLLGALLESSSDIEQWYAFELAGEESKLGRNASIIEIRPQDDFRYGHRLWIDQLTAIPLKVQLLDPTGRTVEQIQFVSIVVPAEIPDARLQPDVEVDGFTWFEQEAPAQQSAVTAAAWRVTDPPPGFTLSESRVRTLPGGDHAVEHLVYSDGLASVSLFVEPAEATDGELAGLSRMGAAHAFTLVLEGRQVTAVGEVPPKTVERMARSLRAAEAALN